MVRDIAETFQTLRKINMKLNPKKCSFGLAEGVFLGYVITPEGIKPCPDKTSTVLQLPSPQTIKEVQSLNKKLASLNRSGTKLLTNGKAGIITGLCSKKASKVFAGTSYRAPKPQEELIMYLFATHGAIDGTDTSLLHKPCITRSETKLLTNGKAGIITGLCSKKASKIFSGTSYRDFLNKIPNNALQSTSVAETQEETWTLFTDGSSCVDGSGAGLILTNPDGIEFTYALRFQFAASNNEAEYEALIAGKEVTAVIEKEGPIWMTELVNYLKEGILPADEKKARKIRPLQAEYVIKEIHEGSCSMHAGPRSVVAKAIRLGYFWPTMHSDAHDMICKCNDCQKWIEAKAVETITGGQVKKFVWDNIVCRFGIPGEIISDNGKQFADNPFKDWCDKLNITQHFASVKHPQSNELVERANRSLGEGIKARLGEGNKNWVEELPQVLWAHRTMVKSSHGNTPFSLTYRTEAVIPAEIGMPTYRTTVVDAVNNDEELRLNLDLLEERRELAAINEARSKSKNTKYYNSRVRGVAFQPGDFVYRSNDASHAAAGGKLGPKWEGPYEVTDALGNEAYKLCSMEGTMLPRTWNVVNLKRCYL
nr:reverse transcriptase domain-containing protein [Tanacetum cinerariifolium]